MLFIFEVHSKYFNPRARKGRDVVRYVSFQVLHGFNPRARKGRDLEPLRKSEPRRVSIHAPAKGATAYNY